MSPLADHVIKIGASLLKVSEVDVLEACLLDKVQDLVKRNRLIMHLLETQEVPIELQDAVEEARLQMTERWEKKSSRK